MRKNIILLGGIFVLIISIVGCQSNNKIVRKKPIPTNNPKATLFATQKPIDRNQSTVTPKENINASTDIKDAKDKVDAEQKKAIDLVVKELKLSYNKHTDDYSQKGKSYNVFLIPYGSDKNGRYEIRICPSFYPLSVYNYCYVDLKNGTITTEP